MRTLATYEPITSMIMHWIARDTRFRCTPGLGEVLAENKRLVVAISHSTPLSWLPASCLLIAHACARGGGHRRPVGVMDRVFFQLPLIDRIAHYFTQSERPLTVPEIIERFQLFDNVDLAVFPEGSNCFFGKPDEIQDFRSPRFVEIAVSVGAPVLICVHRGSEEWATTFPVQPEMVDHLDFLPKFAFDFLEHRLRKTGLFVLPLLPKPMDRFVMRCELYHPKLKVSDLSHDMIERREQLHVESERIRLRMRELLEELDREELQKKASVPEMLDAH